MRATKNEKLQSNTPHTTELGPKSLRIRACLEPWSPENERARVLDYKSYFLSTLTVVSRVRFSQLCGEWRRLLRIFVHKHTHEIVLHYGVRFQQRPTKTKRPRFTEIRFADARRWEACETQYDFLGFGTNSVASRVSPPERAHLLSDMNNRFEFAAHPTPSGRPTIYIYSVRGVINVVLGCGSMLRQCSCCFHGTRPS